MTADQLAGLLDEHTITIEAWSFSRVVLLCSCQVVPLSRRVVVTADDSYTTEDASGLTLTQLGELAAAHLAEVTA